MAKYPSWSIDHAGDCLAVLWNRQASEPVTRMEFMLPAEESCGLEIFVSEWMLKVRFSNAGKVPFLPSGWWGDLANNIFTFCTESDHSPFERVDPGNDWSYVNPIGGEGMRGAFMILDVTKGSTLLDRLNFVHALVGFIVGQLVTKVEWLD